MSLGEPSDPGSDTPAALVFADRERSMRLMVDEIIDVRRNGCRSSCWARSGSSALAVIASKSTDLIDTGYWLTQVSQDWFRGSAHGTRGHWLHVLAVEDSDFFRQFCAHLVVADGYQVTP